MVNELIRVLGRLLNPDLSLLSLKARFDQEVKHGLKRTCADLSNYEEDNAGD